MKGINAIYGLIFLVSCGQIFSQKTVFISHGDPYEQAFGSFMAGVGDIDLDGFNDIAFTRAQKNPTTQKYTPCVDICSGRNWTLIRRIWGDYTGIISLACVGDVNRDGVPDMAAGKSGYQLIPMVDSGRAFVFSGKDGSIIHSWKPDEIEDIYFGVHVSGGGDIDCDGVPDTIITSSYPTKSSYANVYSGRTGNILYSIKEVNGDRRGVRGMILGDVNMDGYADFAISATSSRFNGDLSGSVYVYSGIDGRILYRVDGRIPKAELGNRLFNLGDVNQDGIPDFVVGARNSAKFMSLYSGYIEVFSGKDGKSLLYLEGENGMDWFGFCLAAVGDTNGDGIPDFATISGPPSNPVYLGTDRFIIFSGKGNQLCQYPWDPLKFQLEPGGAPLIGPGDIDGDGLSDFSFSLMLLYPKDRKDRLVEVHAPFGTIPLQADKQALSLSRGESLQFQLDGGKPLSNQWYILLGSLSGTTPGLQIGPAHLPLQPDLYFFLSAGSPGGLHQRPFGLLDAQGRMTTSFKLDPRFPSEVVGARLHHAFFGFQANPPWIQFASNAVETEIVR